MGRECPTGGPEQIKGVHNLVARAKDRPALSPRLVVVGARGVTLPAAVGRIVEVPHEHPFGFARGGLDERIQQPARCLDLGWRALFRRVGPVHQPPQIGGRNVQPRGYRFNAAPRGDSLEIPPAFVMVQFYAAVLRPRREPHVLNQRTGIPGGQGNLCRIAYQWLQPTELLNVNPNDLAELPHRSAFRVL